MLKYLGVSHQHNFDEIVISNQQNNNIVYLPIGKLKTPIKTHVLTHMHFGVVLIVYNKD